ncbi:hypothetical protein ACWELJ_09160 [Nocardia sp. NPDC004582]
MTASQISGLRRGRSNRSSRRSNAVAAVAEGYRATIVSGEVVLRDGADTGARPGALIRLPAR